MFNIYCLQFIFICEKENLKDKLIIFVIINNIYFINNNALKITI